MGSLSPCCVFRPQRDQAAATAFRWHLLLEALAACKLARLLPSLT